MTARKALGVPHLSAFALLDGQVTNARHPACVNSGFLFCCCFPTLFGERRGAVLNAQLFRCFRVVFFVLGRIHAGSGCGVLRTRYSKEIIDDILHADDSLPFWVECRTSVFGLLFLGMRVWSGGSTMCKWGCSNRF